MKQINDNRNFIAQAGILAAAGIVSRIIGLLYRSPLTGIIGDEGNGYYNYAINIYAIILLIASYSIPSALSKLIAGKLAFKEYRNAHRIFHCTLIYVVVVGGIASLVAFFAAPLLVVENAVPVLRIFAPAIFFSGLCGVLRGYFQAHRTMVQTSVSQILEQIVNALVSIGAAYGLTQLVKDKDVTTKAVYGAMGSAIGTGSGVIMALLFMLAVYLMNRKVILKRVARDKTGKLDSYGDIFKMLFFIVTPFILSTFIYNFSTSLDQTLYTKLMMGLKGLTQEQTASFYGVFNTKAITIVNIPIALATAMSAAIMPNVSGLYARGEMEDLKKKVRQAVKVSMLIAIPSAVGLAVLSRPIMQILFPQRASLDLASVMLSALSVTVIFFSLSTLTMGVLQGIGKVNAPVINAGISLVVQTAVLVGILVFTDWNLYALVLANVAYSLLMCLLNEYRMRKHLGMKQELSTTFMRPSLCAALMGVAARAVYEGIALILPGEMEMSFGGNLLAVIPSMAVAVLVYLVLIIKTGTVSEAELYEMPKGRSLVGICKKFRLL
ncbi:MAG: polysaccharide biosynthesis protein [Lachnospiraceae bacterium]|nr:polysaccharide biosynthesis protein [Lachnospiraceae bacterium]